jgi:hypothetical protein
MATTTTTRRLVAHTDEENLQRWLQWDRTVEFVYQYTPRASLVALTTLLWVGCALLVVPATILFRHAAWRMAVFVFVQGPLAMGMLIQAFVRSVVSEDVDGVRYDMTHEKLAPLLGIVALVSAALELVGIGLLAYNVAGCPTRNTNVALGTFIFNTTTIGYSTDWTALHRLPYFADEATWFQLCLDDYSVTLIVLSALALNALLCIAAGVFEFRLPSTSERVVQRIAAAQAAGTLKETHVTVFPLMQQIQRDVAKVEALYEHRGAGTDAEETADMLVPPTGALDGPFLLEQHQRPPRRSQLSGAGAPARCPPSRAQ